MYLSICSFSVCLSVFLSFYLSNYLSFYLSVHLSICVYLQTWKRSYLAKLLLVLSLAASKTQPFCEISSMFELDNVKNEAILRDFLNFRGWQHQQTKQFCETSFKNGRLSLSAEPMASYQCVLQFVYSIYLKCCAGHEKWGGVIRSAARVTQKHLSKPGDLMLQNATLLRKSAPAPPNIFDSCVYCIAPATRNSSLRILFKSPTPANVFWNCYETVTFWLLLAGCIVPCACHTLPHKTTLQRPKWPWCALYMLTSKRASRHNGVRLFDSSTSKGCLRPTAFTLSTSTCASAPHRRALFDISTSKSAPKAPLPPL